MLPVYEQGVVFAGALVTDIWGDGVSLDACIPVRQVVPKQPACLFRDYCHRSQLVILFPVNKLTRYT